MADRFHAVARPRPLRVTTTSLEKRLQGKITSVVDRSTKDAHALELLVDLVLERLDARDRHREDRRRPVA